jgi:hypothetical protein
MLEATTGFGIAIFQVVSENGSSSAAFTFAFPQQLAALLSSEANHHEPTELGPDQVDSPHAGFPSSGAG